MTEQQLRENMVRIAKSEYRCGMVNMFEGNISCRWEGRYFITPSQVSKETMTPEMVIEIDAEGNVVKALPGLRPSTEYKMHLEVYRLRPDVAAVIHNHSTYATAFACNNMPLDSDILTEMNLTLGPVPVAPYGTPGTERLYAGFQELIGDTFAMLLENHGVLTYADDLDLAYSYAEAVEKIAKTLFIARLLGEGAHIPAEEIASMQEYGRKNRRKRIEAARNRAAQE